MSQLSLGFQALYICSCSMNALELAVDKDGDAQRTSNTSHESGTVRGTARRPHFSLAFISVTVQLRIQVFLVISVYFNLKNILPKSGSFPPGHPVYTVVLYHYYPNKTRMTHLKVSSTFLSVTSVRLLHCTQK